MRISSLLSALPQTSLLTSARVLRLVALTLSGAMFLSQSAFAANNDAGGFFAAVGQAVVTGPTLTNVNDFRAILIGADV